MLEEGAAGGGGGVALVLRYIEVARGWAREIGWGRLRNLVTRSGAALHEAYIGGDHWAPHWCELSRATPGWLVPARAPAMPASSHEGPMRL